MFKIIITELALMGSSKLKWAIIKTNLVSTKNREFSVLLAYYVILFNLKLLKLPKAFEVRWSQFSYTLLNNVLVSWSCLVNYFKNSSDKVYVEHFKFLTHEYNIRLMAVLADVLYIFSRYQQQLQSDDLNVISMDEKTMYIINKIEMLKSTPFIEGRVETLDKQVAINKDGSLTLNSITIKSIEIPRHKSHHKFVTYTK